MVLAGPPAAAQSSKNKKRGLRGSLNMPGFLVCRAPNFSSFDFLRAPPRATCVNKRGGGGGEREKSLLLAISRRITERYRKHFQGGRKHCHSFPRFLDLVRRILAGKPVVIGDMYGYSFFGKPKTPEMPNDAIARNLMGVSLRNVASRMKPDTHLARNT